MEDGDLAIVDVDLHAFQVVASKRLLATAAVRIEIDGVEMLVHGLRLVERQGRAEIEFPRYRDEGGQWRDALSLPAELIPPIRTLIADEAAARGLVEQVP
ncbi:MAG: hypothetical protein RLY86_2052 [Pseudomonadota bacterium]|jgi:DNA-binding cell septation regulator SpoVG